MGIINAECGKTVRIAYQGENKRQKVRFDLADIMTEFPGGTAVLAILRNGDETVVPASMTEMDGTSLLWTVTAWECEHDGFLYAQVTYATADGVVAKDKKYRFDIKDSLIVGGVEPETWEDYVGQLVTAAAGVNDAISSAMDTLDAKVADAQAAQNAAEIAQGKAEDAQAAAEAAVGQYDDMTAEAEGLAAGEDPTAEIDHMGDHPVLKLGIPAGEKGDPGDPGDPGAPGYSPVAVVTKSGKVATITLIDKNGTTSAQISDGEDGTTAIDDTAGAGDTDKTFSADKLTTMNSELLNEINGKQDAPETAGTAGQVLSLDSNLDPVWSTPQSGGGSVNDVQINGTSIVSSGVANIPIASSSNLGVAKVNSSYGIRLLSNNSLATNYATGNEIKSGSDSYKPMTPYNHNYAAFYGLARAAGDSTQKSSSNAVGDYTEDAKSSISEMLNGAVSVSGTTPSINAKAGVRYVCGEVSTLTIVVPSSGCIDVTFTSGSTPTVLTVTPPTGMTMKWANGFDPTALEANTTYEINIMDGCLGVAGSWT